MYVNKQPYLCVDIYIYIGVKYEESLTFVAISVVTCRPPVCFLTGRLPGSSRDPNVPSRGFRVL